MLDHLLDSGRAFRARAGALLRACVQLEPISTKSFRRSDARAGSEVPRSLCVLRLFALALFALTVFAGDGFAAQKITVVPAEVTLFGTESRQPLLVQRMTTSDLTSQITSGVEFVSADPEVAIVERGIVRPVANGKTSVTARVGGQEATVKITVVQMDRPHVWSFRNHVQPVFAKVGCNSGSCHGALAGKGGFKLSLRGYDTVRDFHTITRQARGRRIELSDPGRSLLLAKPSGAIPHKGGLRFDVDSPEYRVLAGWISAGAAPPREDDARLQRIEVLPQKVLLQPGDQQQILVRAHYSNGHRADVTRWAKFASANEAVATINDTGQLSVVGSGEGAVTAWFASKIVLAKVTSPYSNHVPVKVFAEAKRRNFIDQLVLQQLQRLDLPPSEPATDHEFMRRALIDTIGVLPTAAAVRVFLADTAVDKRDRLIESLLSRPEFVDYWTYKWSDLLLVTGEKLRPKPVDAYYQWIRKHVEANTPWDDFVYQTVTSQGSSYEDGATNFYALHQDPESMSENVCQAFLGLSIGCAKCHNHPLEKWTNDQYYGLANLFARVRAKGWGGAASSGDGLRTVFVVDKGELIQPLTGKPQPPTPLDGEPLRMDDTRDRRIHLANWLTSADNPYFARSICNRVWANFMGVGLVEQVDDMRISNPASNEQLLSALADFLVAHEFDLRALMRAILQSETYQRSSRPLPGNQNEHRFYSRYYPRRMMAEVLLDAISQVTSVPSVFNELSTPGAAREKTELYPLGTRALQLHDAAVASYFLKTFGRNQRQITCECERSDEPSMVQVLHISNGDTINDKLQTIGNRVAKLLALNKPNYALIEQVYLEALARYPTDDEMQRLLQVMNEASDQADRRIVVEDLFWSVMSSREFLFNH